jgi:hypothetical protein
MPTTGPPVSTASRTTRRRRRRTSTADSLGIVGRCRRRDGSAGASGSAPATAAAPASSSSAASLVAWAEIPARRLPDGVRLPADVRPALVDARTDRERLADDGCFTWLEGSRPADCVYGDEDGRITVALIGDSHAGQWFPAINALARRNGWRLIPLVKASCPFVDMPVLHPFAKREYTECATWRRLAIRAVNDARPDLVIVATAYRGIRPILAADGTAKAQGEAMARAIDQLRAPVAIVIDSPRTDTDIPACLSRHPRDVQACAIPRAEAFDTTFGIRERVAAKRSGATLQPDAAPNYASPVVRDG